jgi:hypothetical protein
MNPDMNPTADPVDAFRESLAQTIAWCSSQPLPINPAQALRSPELRPGGATNTWFERVEYVRAQRLQSLRGMHSELPLMPYPGSGNLLIFDPEQSLSDGASEVESNGFFDAENTPPWDLWVAYIQEPKQRSNLWSRFDAFVLCWIPPAFTELVDRAIAVNPEKCIEWAKDFDSPFIRRLRVTNLL